LQRAEKIYGERWEEIITRQNRNLEEKFKTEPLVFFERQGRNEKGVFKLGWRYEMTYDSTRKLRFKILQDIRPQVYYCKGCEERYVHCLVGGNVVRNSGMPNYVLVLEPERIESSSEIFSNLVPMEEFLELHNEVWADFLAQNYRSHKNRQEGANRHLAVYVNWEVDNQKLKGTFVFDNPLQMTSGNALNNLQDCLDTMGIQIGDGFDIDQLRGRIHPDTLTFG